LKKIDRKPKENEMRIKAFFATLMFSIALSIANVSFVTAQQEGRPAKQTRTAPVMLQCHNYGGQQDVSKNPDIINSTQNTIPSGKTLYWKSSDGDGGSIKLSKALPAGGKVGVTGKAGQSYTCTAWMTK
jgi:uncharacterized protein YlxW (UPF0749 family)